MVEEDGIVPLRYVKFQNVEYVTVSSALSRWMQRVVGDNHAVFSVLNI